MNTPTNSTEENTSGPATSSQEASTSTVRAYAAISGMVIGFCIAAAIALIIFAVFKIGRNGGIDGE